MYVDDFKLAGPTGNLNKGWGLIRQKVRTEDPTPLGKYLGCSHVETSRVVDMSSPEFAPFIWPVPIGMRPNSKASPASAQGGEANGDQSPVEGCSLPGGKTPLVGQKGRIAVRCLEYDMSSFLQSCVERYQELVPKKVNLRRVDTPYPEDTETVETEEPRGELQPIASRILMKILYAARMCRFDLLRPCCFLATRITKWGTSCDKAFAQACVLYK